MNAESGYGVRRWRAGVDEGLKEGGAEHKGDGTRQGEERSKSVFRIGQSGMMWGAAESLSALRQSRTSWLFFATIA
jgi:hypothetical protein